MQRDRWEDEQERKPGQGEIKSVSPRPHFFKRVKNEKVTKLDPAKKFYEAHTLRTFVHPSYVRLE